MKREFFVVKHATSDRIEKVDLETLDGPALCVRKKMLEARLATPGVTDDDRAYARREVQRVDAVLARRKGERRAVLAAGGARLAEHLAFLHAFLRTAKAELPKEDFSRLAARATELAASGVVTCNDCKERDPQ